VTTHAYQAAVLKGLGSIEALVSELGLLRSSLEAAPLWRPAAGLARQCAESVRMIRRIAARLERRPVVTIIGPSGSGKSTLLNALAGGEELSPTGHSRPTTDQLIVFGAGEEDAAELLGELSSDSVRIASAAGAHLPERLCLIDTPDTDSMAFRRHVPALEQAIAHSDVLLCVFDAENPKRRDHADFLAPFVQRFDGESLIALLNKCDRLDEGELQTSILPDFRDYLQYGWHGKVDRVLCVCARRHLRKPGWDPSAGPRHDFDQFEELRRLVVGHMNRGSLVIDRRVSNARQLHAVVLGETARELSADGPTLEAARRTLAAAQADAMVSAASALRDNDSGRGGGLGSAVYQKLSIRWVGPVGWMLALWTRLVTIGSGIASVLRLGRPSASGLLRRRPGKRTSGLGPESLEAALRHSRLALLARWPEVSDHLVRGRFDAAVRSIDTPMTSAARFAEQLSNLWEGAIEQEIEGVARRLGGLWLQVLMNAPVVGILGYVGWVTVHRFFRGDYLTGDYFLHAFWVIAIALLLSFIVLQVLIRLAAGSERILARAFERLQNELGEFDGLEGHPLSQQLETVLRLAEAASGQRTTH
jgi:energy-coupling factor transporter ATP-binding protein EcfA2